MSSLDVTFLSNDLIVDSSERRSGGLLNNRLQHVNLAEYSVGSRRAVHLVISCPSAQVLKQFSRFHLCFSKLDR